MRGLVLIVAALALGCSACILRDRCGVLAKALECGDGAVARCEDPFDDVEEPVCFDCEPGRCVMNAEAFDKCNTLNSAASTAAQSCNVEDENLDDCILHWITSRIRGNHGNLHQMRQCTRRTEAERRWQILCQAFANITCNLLL